MAKVSAGTVGVAGRGLATAALLFLAPHAKAGETRCWVDRGAVVVPAAFGDIAGDFILDLARPTGALHNTRANADGLTGSAATEPLRVAGESLGETTLPIVDLDAETRAFPTSINGVLGADVARGRVLTLDLRKGGCRLGLWRDTRRTRRRSHAGMAVVWVDGVPAIQAFTSDGPHTRAGLFALGTAYSATSLSHAKLSRKPDGQAPIRLRALEVGGRLFEQIPAEVGPAPVPGLAGAIGTSVLSGGRLTLDGRRGLLRVQWPTLRQRER